MTRLEKAIVAPSVGAKPTVPAMPTPHVSVCVCTFKRAELLRKLLERLEHQQSDGLFTYSVIVADNDPAQTARRVVASFSAVAPSQVTYCFESRRNIALVRNKALQHARGEFISFIDDDEYPEGNWLLNLFKACAEYGVDGVLGPVKPYFELEPPAWARKGQFFERPMYRTGYKMSWGECRTGNLFLKKQILDAVDTPFLPEFGTGGEDVDFFRRMIGKGFKFIWCNEAVVHEFIPSNRCSRRFLLRRAVLRGSNFSRVPTHRIRNGAKSLIAVPCYALSLPFLFLFGQHVFLKYLIKLLDHASRLIAFVGLRPLKYRET